MEYNLFVTLYGEASEMNEFHFLADRGWQEWMSNYSDDELGKILLLIHELARKSIKEKREKLEISRTQMSRDFCIPVRTLENWENGYGDIPPYVEIMIAYIIFNNLMLKWREKHGAEKQD